VIGQRKKIECQEYVSHQQFSRRLFYCIILIKFQALSFPVHGTQKVAKLRIADFIHGSDGLGNQNFPPPATKPIDQSAAAFLVEQANLCPGQVTVVALGPLTNLALVWSALPCLFTELDACTTTVAAQHQSSDRICLPFPNGSVNHLIV
jgi:hypothetical protein